MLCGGHVPTQNHYFAQLGLPGLFHNYHGIVLGVSAGSMNAAHIVYAAPEEPGEAADPHYSRWMNGLGLTETRILPHYQFIRDHVLDGQKVEDIALADSKKRHFLALPEQTQEEIFRYYFLRQPQRVIGVHIGRTRSTAGRHIRLALQRLRRLMEGNDYE